MGLASIVQRAARLFGYQVINPQRLGIDLQNDIIRLSAQEPVRVVLDVGGNVGQTACEYTSYFPQAQIYTFEPVPASFAKLQSAVANLPRVKAFQMAVGSSTGTVFMNVGDDSQLNSIVKVKDSTSVIEVPLDSLDHIVSSLSLDQIDLLKIDVEGFELEVLKGAVRRWEWWYGGSALFSRSFVMSRASLAMRVSGRSNAGKAAPAPTPVAPKPAPAPVATAVVQQSAVSAPSVSDWNSLRAREAILQALSQRGFDWS